MDSGGHFTHQVYNFCRARSQRKVLAILSEQRSADGTVKSIDVKARIDTLVELEYYKHGGILQYVLRQLLKS